MTTPLKVIAVSVFQRLLSTLQVFTMRAGELTHGVLIGDGDTIIEQIQKERESKEVKCDYCGTPITNTDEIGLVFIVDNKYRISCEKFYCREEGLHNFRWNGSGRGGVARYGDT